MLVANFIFSLSIFYCVVQNVRALADQPRKRAITTVGSLQYDLSTEIITFTKPKTVVSTITIPRTSTIENYVAVTNVISTVRSSFIPSTVVVVVTNTVFSTLAQLSESTLPIISTVTTEVVYATFSEDKYPTPTEVIYTIPTSVTTEFYIDVPITSVEEFTSYSLETYYYKHVFYTEVPTVVTESDQTYTSSVVDLAVSTIWSSYEIYTITDVLQSYHYLTSTSTYVSTITEIVSTATETNILTSTHTYTTTIPLQYTTTLGSLTKTSTEYITVANTETVTNEILTSIEKYTVEYITEVYNKTMTVETIEDVLELVTSTSITTELSTRVITLIVSTSTDTNIASVGTISGNPSVALLSNSKGVGSVMSTASIPRTWVTNPTGRPTSSSYTSSVGTISTLEESSSFNYVVSTDHYKDEEGSIGSGMTSGGQTSQSSLVTSVPGASNITNSIPASISNADEGRSVSERLESQVTLSGSNTSQVVSESHPTSNVMGGHSTKYEKSTLPVVSKGSSTLEILGDNPVEVQSSTLQATSQRSSVSISAKPGESGVSTTIKSDESSMSTSVKPGRNSVSTPITPKRSSTSTSAKPEGSSILNSANLDANSISTSVEAGGSSLSISVGPYRSSVGSSNKLQENIVSTSINPESTFCTTLSESNVSADQSNPEISVQIVASKPSMSAVRGHTRHQANPTSFAGGSHLEIATPGDTEAFQTTGTFQTLVSIISQVGEGHYATVVVSQLSSVQVPKPTRLRSTLEDVKGRASSSPSLHPQYGSGGVRLVSWNLAYTILSALLFM